MHLSRTFEGSPHGRHGPGLLGPASPMSWRHWRTFKQLQVDLGAETIDNLAVDYRQPGGLLVRRYATCGQTS